MRSLSAAVVIVLIVGGFSVQAVSAQTGNMPDWWSASGPITLDEAIEYFRDYVPPENWGDSAQHKRHGNQVDQLCQLVMKRGCNFSQEQLMSNDKFRSASNGYVQGSNYNFSEQVYKNYVPPGLRQIGGNGSSSNVSAATSHVSEFSSGDQVQSGTNLAQSSGLPSGGSAAGPVTFDEVYAYFRDSIPPNWDDARKNPLLDRLCVLIRRRGGTFRIDGINRPEADKLIKVSYNHYQGNLWNLADVLRWWQTAATHDYIQADGTRGPGYYCRTWSVGFSNTGMTESTIQRGRYDITTYRTTDPMVKGSALNISPDGTFLWRRPFGNVQGKWRLDSPVNQAILTSSDGRQTFYVKEDECDKKSRCIHILGGAGNNWVAWAPK